MLYVSVQNEPRVHVYELCKEFGLLLGEFQYHIPSWHVGRDGVPRSWWYGMKVCCFDRSDRNDCSWHIGDEGLGRWSWKSCVFRAASVDTVPDNLIWVDELLYTARDPSWTMLQLYMTRSATRVRLKRASASPTSCDFARERQLRRGRCHVAQQSRESRPSLTSTYGPDKSAALCSSM